MKEEKALTKIKSQWETHHDDIFFCDCYDRNHAIELSFDDEKEDWRYLSFIDRMRPYNLRQRIRLAWRMLAGKQECAAEVILSNENIYDLTKVLVRRYYITQYGYDVNAHIERLKLGVADYFNSKHSLIDLDPEEATADLLKRCIELIDIFDENTNDPDKISDAS